PFRRKQAARFIGRSAPLEPPSLGGDRDRLTAVARPELADRGAEVVAHSTLREVERGRDGRGGVVASGGGKHVLLAGRQRALALGDRGHGERLVENAPARGNLTDRSGELARPGILEQKAARAVLERATKVAGTAERGQDERAGLGELARELARGGDPVEPRHLDVEQRDVGTRRLCRRQDAVAPVDLRDDLDVFLQGKQAREGAANHRLIFGDENADHDASSGTVRRSRKPPSGLAPASRRPRTPFARCASPASPLPSRPADVSTMPSSSTSTAALSPFLRMRMSQCSALLWRTTLVAPSRTAQASTASTSGETATSPPSTR